MKAKLLKTIRAHCEIRYIPDINKLRPVEGFRYTASQGYLITNKRTGDWTLSTNDLRSILLDLSRRLIPRLAYHFKTLNKRREAVKDNKWRRDYYKSIDLTVTREL